jgi:hypothetical protein
VLVAVATTDSVGADDVLEAASVATSTLAPLAGADWDATAGELDMSCRATLEHVVEGLAFYARDLATPVIALPGDDELVLRCGEATPISGLVEGLSQVAAVLATVVAGVPAGRRAFHPFGMADPSGFAAMACDEILIHTDDIATGLGAGFAPPVDLCERVLGRLFPWAPDEGDAWDRLRWANGRLALASHPRLDPDWGWHCAPLDEWDGTRVTR